MTRAELLEKAKPILFNTEMVRAILDGRKTVTRRVIKQQLQKYVQMLRNGDVETCWDGGFDNGVKRIKPQYRIGDILYVRETWFKFKDTFYYMADGKHISLERMGIRFKWRPSIHMPKEAARIILRATNVRVERLQDITVEDAKREGAFLSCNMCVHWHDFCGQQVTQAKDCKIDGIAPLFPRLWNSTIRPADMPKYGWDANPWVWVYEFERVVPE